MTELDTLAFAFNQFADLSADDFKLSTSFWHRKEYKKGAYFNHQKTFAGI